MTNVLNWYGNRAADLARYAMAEPPMTTAIAAVVQELALDAGRRSEEKPRIFIIFYTGKYPDDGDEVKGFVSTEEDAERLAQYLNTLNDDKRRVYYFQEIPQLAA